MKKTLILTLSMMLAFSLNSQNYEQQEILCPCMLEFHFPKSIEDQTDLLQTFGGVPVLRFESAEIDGKQLICKYSTEFAKFYFEGFGFVLSRSGGLSAVPYELTLTIDDQFITGWSPSRNTVNLESYYRGDLVYTLEVSDNQNSSWSGGLYKSKYNGNQINLKRSFENEARVNNEGSGFIIAKTKTGLFSPNLNLENINNPNIKGRQSIDNKTIADSTKKNVSAVNSKETTKTAKVGTKSDKKELKRTKKKIIK